MIHYHMTLDEHRATRLMGYVDPDRYREGHRDYQPEMICRTGDGHAWKNSTRDWAKVTCPACLARKPDNDIERRGTHSVAMILPSGWRQRSSSTKLDCCAQLQSV